MKTVSSRTWSAVETALDLISLFTGKEFKWLPETLYFKAKMHLCYALPAHNAVGPVGRGRSVPQVTYLN